MYASSARPNDPLVRQGSLLPSFIVVVVLAALYAHFSGPTAPDWVGYSELYDYEGGWLFRTGRDPLFVWILHESRLLFGVNGYQSFRFSVFIAFLSGGAWLAYRMPLRGSWPIIPAMIVIAALMLKGLVQIREGLAFLLISMALLRIFVAKRGYFTSGLLALIAIFIHAGAGLFTGVWLLAAALFLAPDWVLGGRAFPTFLTGLAAAVGFSLAFFVLNNASTLEFLLRDLGADTSTEAVGGIWKFAYWLGNGAIIFVVRRQILRSAHGSTKFGFAYSTVIGAFVLPAIYTICVTLVFGLFYLPAVTSFMIRLLISSVQLSLLIVGLRGRADLYTLGVAAASLADQTRLLFADFYPPH